MKVLQIIDNLDPGGAERMAVNIANSLTTCEGVRSFICVTRKQGILLNEVYSDVGILSLNRKMRVDIDAIRKLRNFIKTEKIDILHCHSTSIFIGFASVLFNPNIKLIYHEHNGERGKKVSDRVTYRLVGFVATSIIVVSEPQRLWFLQKLKISSKKIIKIPNFIPEKPSELINYKEINKKFINIVCVGNIREPKDHINLISAFSLICKKFPNTHLHIIGDIKDQIIGEQLKVISSDFSDQVTFWGRREDVMQIIKNMDIGVLSSRYEAFPVALLEYGMAGLPVVTTDVGECPEIVDHGYSAILVPKENSKKLADAIEFLLLDRNERIKFGARLFRKIITSFNEKRIVEILLKLYND